MKLWDRLVGLWPWPHNGAALAEARDGAARDLEQTRRRSGHIDELARQADHVARRANWFVSEVAKTMRGGAT